MISNNNNNKNNKVCLYSTVNDKVLKGQAEGNKIKCKQRKKGWNVQPLSSQVVVVRMNSWKTKHKKDQDDSRITISCMKKNITCELLEHGGVEGVVQLVWLVSWGTVKKKKKNVGGLCCRRSKYISTRARTADSMQYFLWRSCITFPLWITLPLLLAV